MSKASTSTCIHGDEPITCSVQDCRPEYGINLTIRRGSCEFTIMGVAQSDCAAIIAGAAKVIAVGGNEPKED